MSEINDTVLNRVLALIAKAESTEFPEERDAFMAKAQAIMAREAIDQAMLDGHAGRQGDGPIVEIVIVPAPYAMDKAILLDIIGKANGCQGLIDGRVHTVKGSHAYALVGHPADVQATTTLFAALSMHAVGDMLNVTAPSGAKTVAARKRFMSGFISRLKVRLDEARDTARREYEAETGQSTALVLRDRAALVRKAYGDHTEGARTSTVQRSARGDAAFHAGAASANRAGLGGTAMPAGRAAIGAGR